LPYQKTATVTRILDGDTFEAIVDGKTISIRVAGINTNEVSHAKMCWADEATDRLEELIDEKQVVLTARHKDSLSLGRPIRHVYLQGDGGYTDIAEVLVEEGFGTALIFDTEPDFAERYQQAFWSAVDRGDRLHNPDGCGVGPDRGMELVVSAIWDADGNDDENVNGEYTKIRNAGSTPANLKDWLFHDSTATADYHFGNVVIPPGETLVISAGKGTDTASHLFLGRDKPMLSPTDGVYVFDADEDLRFFSSWPCYNSCRSPEGDLRILEAVADPPGVDTPDNETVTLYNPTSQPVPVHDFRLEDYPFVLDLQLPPTGPFPNNGIVPPSGRVIVHVGSGTNSFEPASGSTPAEIHVYWNKAKTMLTNTGDTVKIVTLDAQTWDCLAWGKQTCDDDPGIAPPLTSHVERVAGSNRYNTSAALAASSDPSDISTVYVVTGGAFPDGLVAAVAAGRAGGLVLLTQTKSIPSAVRSELSRLDPDRIVIAGGPAAVSPKVEKDLQNFAPDVTRLSGADRYDTAALVAKMSYPEGADIVYLASGANFPDALAASPVAAFTDGPVLLTRSNSLPKTTRKVIQSLNPSKIVVIGGEAAVSAKVFDVVDSLTDATMTRRAGSNRYSSAAQLSKTTFPSGVDAVYIATGTAFPDGVSAAGSAALAGGPMLLTSPASVPGSVLAEIERLNPGRVVVVGGTAAISLNAYDQIRAAAGD
jgi:putative cell wall-binding protein